MIQNRISIELTNEQVKAINDSVKVIVETLEPVVIALLAEDKKNMAKLGEKSVSFAEKTMQYMETNPEFLPAYVSVAEVKKDYTAFNQLNTILRPLMQIIGNVDDTATLCGSDTINACLTYYASVSQAAKMKVPNAQAIYDDLSQRFEGQRVKGNKPAKP